VSEKYCPGFADVDEYLKDVRETTSMTSKPMTSTVKNGVEDKQFVAGEQWDPGGYKQRQGLPCLVINTIPQFTAQLVGDWRENKIGIKVLPAERRRQEVADVVQTSSGQSKPSPSLSCI
jgi:hypothetical protein